MMTADRTGDRESRSSGYAAVFCAGLLIGAVATFWIMGALL